MSQPPDNGQVHDQQVDALARRADRLVDDLCAAAVEGHRRLFDSLLGGIDLAASGTGRSDRLPADLVERLRLDRSRLQRRYLGEIGRRFRPPGLMQPSGGSAERELQGYTRPPSEVLQEQVALAARSRRLRAPLETQLQALEQKLRALVRRAALPIATTAYSPSTSVESFRVALEALDMELPQRQWLFDYYEAAASTALGEILAQALGILHRQSDGIPAVHARHGLTTLDEAMLQVLRGETSSGLKRGDAGLAALLLAMVHDTSGSESETHAVVQRVVLLGQLCSAWFEHLQPDTRRDAERLRFTLIKIALADSGFLLSAGHPLRLLLRDACEHRDPQRRQQACARIDQVAMSAEFVLQGLPDLAALSAQQIDSCLDQLHQQDGRREEMRLAEARRSVAQALAHATLLQARPQGLRLFLRGGWGPLMTQRLLKHGQPSIPWQQALDQLDRLLSALSSESTRVRDFEQLLVAVAAELFEAGMSSGRCERLQQALREAYYELRTGADGGDPVNPASASSDGMPGIGSLDLPELSQADMASATPPAMPGSDEFDLELRPLRGSP